MCDSFPVLTICVANPRPSAFQLQDILKFDTDVMECELNMELPWRNR